MKPNVCQLITLSEWGGAQHVVYELVRHFKGEFACMVACGPRGELIERVRSHSIPVTVIPALRRNLNPWLDAAALGQILRLLQNGNFSIVHCHSSKAGILGRLAAHITGVPVVLFTAHGWAFTEGRSYWKRWLAALLERIASRWSTKIVCVSHYDRELALRFKVTQPKRLVVIHNGIDPSPFARADGSTVRQEFGLVEDLVITTVGRLAVQKDPLTLLRAYRILDPRNAKVVIAGDGPLRKSVEQYVNRNMLRNRVLLAGTFHNVPALLVASDIFVLASRWEGLPLTIIEAMMAGLPVVATGVGGVAELVEHGVTGIIVPPGNPEALAEAIRQLLEDADLRRRMGQAGRQRALERFTVNRMVAEVKTLYTSLLAG
jgi:glycosyltransferase involved in cell wall biosynthesis